MNVFKTINIKCNLNFKFCEKCLVPINCLIFRYVSNKYFRVNTHQDVEWGYAFDVHLNAFFPPLTILHFCQLFFYNGKFLTLPKFCCY